MSAHPADHEEFLEKLATREVDPRSSLARERLAACEVCSREHEAFERLARGLDALAEEERHGLEHQSSGVEGEERVAAFLARARDASAAGQGPRPASDASDLERATPGLRGPRPSAARADPPAPRLFDTPSSSTSAAPRSAPVRRHGSLRWLALAAAVLAVALVSVRAWTTSRTDTSQALLGEGEFALSSPSGDLRVGGELRLDYRLPADGRFSIVFEGVTDDGRPWRAVRTTSDERWTPPQELFAEMPARVTVRAIAIDASGRSLAVSRELSLPVSR